MVELFEIILGLLPPRLFGFLIALCFIVAGVYLWSGGNDDRTAYDRAVGAESRTYQAEVRRKVIRQESTSGANDHDAGSADVRYLVLSFQEDKGHGKYDSIDARVDRAEYDSVNEGDTIKISFHPENREYVVTPLQKRPDVFWYRFGGSIFIILGLIFILMVLASFA